MKISGSTIAPSALITYSRIAHVSAPSVTGTQSSPAASVERSAFLSQLQEATRAEPFGEVRADKVAQARADMAAGRLGTEADYEAAVRGLLMDL